MGRERGGFETKTELLLGSCWCGLNITRAMVFLMFSTLAIVLRPHGVVLAASTVFLEWFLGMLSLDF